LQNKEELLKRDIDKGALWYEFGRSQGIQTSHKPKIVLSTLMKDAIECHKVDEKTFVYSGIFIIQKDRCYNWRIIEDVLKSRDFLRYIRLTGKDFSGGYKSISTKQIKSFPTKELSLQNTIFGYN
jgi:adenine-specific DNA-methyltransferase